MQSRIQNTRRTHMSQHTIIGTTLVLALAMTAAAAAPANNDPIQPHVTDGSLAGYVLAWQDEFGGDKLDVQKWDYRTDSKMWSTQVPGNVSVGNGTLRIALKKEPAGGKDYTGGGVISKRAFKYGYYEARFKCPPGKGWHTSFWMMFHEAAGGTGTKQARQEIDVCEQDSIDPNSYGANLHTCSPQHKSFGPGRIKTPDLSADFHVWGCEFTPTEVRYFFDGKEVGKRDANVMQHGEQHIWLTSIASPLGGTKAVDDTKLPGTAQFDYVRFYEKK